MRIPTYVEKDTSFGMFNKKDEESLSMRFIARIGNAI